MCRSVPIADARHAGWLEVPIPKAVKSSFFIRQDQPRRHYHRPVRSCRRQQWTTQLVSTSSHSLCVQTSLDYALPIVPLPLTGSSRGLHRPRSRHEKRSPTLHSCAVLTPKCFSPVSENVAYRLDLCVLDFFVREARGVPFLPGGWPHVGTLEVQIEYARVGYDNTRFRNHLCRKTHLTQTVAASCSRAG